jgi:hypothetical protein
MAMATAAAAAGGGGGKATAQQICRSWQCLYWIIQASQWPRPTYGFLLLVTLVSISTFHMYAISIGLSVSISIGLSASISIGLSASKSTSIHPFTHTCTPPPPNTHTHTQTHTHTHTHTHTYNAVPHVRKRSGSDQLQWIPFFILFYFSSGECSWAGRPRTFKVDFVWDYCLATGGWAHG